MSIWHHLKRKYLRVLFISSWYPNKTEPTNGNFVEQHAISIQPYCDLTILHVRAAEVSKVEIEPISNHGLKGFIIYFPPKKLNFFSYLKYYRRGFKLIEESVGKIDLIHLNVILPVGIIAYLAKVFKDIPYLITEHATIYKKERRNELSALRKVASQIIARKAAYICPVSHNLAAEMQSLGIKGNYKVIPNAVNTSLFKAVEKNNSTFNLLHISTLVEEHKNGKGIIRTIKKLSQKRNDFKFKVISDLNINQFEKNAINLGVNMNLFELEGAKNAFEISEAFNAADVFILFSNYENLPCVIIEAHASGVPVISTDVGGINEMITTDNGILIPPKDEDALLTAIEAVMDKKITFDHKAIERKAKAIYSYQSVGQQYFELYQQILGLK